jgi:hypothetical protein
LEGCRVNEVRAGEEERGKANAVVGKADVILKVVDAAVRDLQDTLPALDLERPGETVSERWRSIARVGKCLSAASKLCLACLPSGTRDDDIGKVEETEWMKQVYAKLTEAANVLLRQGLPNIDPPGDDDEAARVNALLRPSSAFLGSFARLFHRVVHLYGSNPNANAHRWISLSTSILQRLLPGDEDDALWIMEELTKAWASLPNPLQDRGFNTSCLIPFLAYAVRTKPDTRIAPISPTPTSIQTATSLTLPASCKPNAGSGLAASGLPLARDWPSIALDHLLHSGTSPVLESLPSSWNISEVEIVRAAMSLIVHVRKAVVEASKNTPESVGVMKMNLMGYAMSAEETVFSCMKVFMLEHGQQQDDSSEEVFRDVQVGNLMDEALRPFTYAASRDGNTVVSPYRSSSLDLEVVSKRFLGASTPFFQFYTDFVALYDAISFSHNLFARLLLAPTGMTYALDYRKHLWGDFGHVLRGIRTPVDDVLVQDLKTFFWPFETDGQMIGWYLRALVKFQLEGFVRLVAVHHVACNIWADLQEGPVREKRAKMLLLAVVGQCKADEVRDVVRYKQAPGGEIKVPPACYPQHGDWVETRLASVAEWGGMAMKRSLEKFCLNDE